MPVARSGAAARRDRDPLAGLLELDGVAEAADETRRAIDRLLVHPVLRRQIPAVAAESTLRGARAAAALSGVDIPLAELRSAEATDPVVRGAVRAYAALGPMVATWPRAPGQVLARLHALAAADLAAPEELGRPQPRAAVGQRLSGLGQLVSEATSTPGVILAGVVHGELAGLAAFGSADRVVALAAARLTMRSRGLDSNAVSVPEVGVLETGADYSTLLAGFVSGTPEGLGAWLRWWSAAVILGAREGLAICEALARDGTP
ncbi:MAG: oxidoreductase [Actinomycetota bacterium]|nr:oxidoreductase [Actinomycetota bacterium]